MYGRKERRERERNGKEPNTDNKIIVEITRGGNSAKKSHLSVITYTPMNSFMNISPDWRTGLTSALFLA